MRSMALRRTSSLTGRLSQPESRRAARVVGRSGIVAPPLPGRTAPGGEPAQPTAATNRSGRPRWLAWPAMARRTTLDLSGSWRAAPASDVDQRFSDESLDDSGWETVPVPGHWRSTAAFADHDGPLDYRTRFATPSGDREPGERSFLVLEGVMAGADVWLDGTYLGDTAGYALSQWFEVTDLLHERDEHLLAMEVDRDPVGTGRVRDLTGAFGRSALLGSGHNPGGIWRPVRIHTTGPVRLRHCRLRCPQADPQKATLAVRVVLDSDAHRSVTLRTWV